MDFETEKQQNPSTMQTIYIYIYTYIFFVYMYNKQMQTKTQGDNRKKHTHSDVTIYITYILKKQQARTMHTHGNIDAHWNNPGKHHKNNTEHINMYLK